MEILSRGVWVARMVRLRHTDKSGNVNQWGYRYNLQKWGGGVVCWGLRGMVYRTL